MSDILDIKRKECYQNNSLGGNFKVNEVYCKLVFDGIMCWNATKSGTLAKQLCPSYLPSSQNFATKKCESNGEWYINTEFNRSWTNYSECWQIIDDETALINFDSIENSTIYHIWFPIIKHVSQSGYVVSLIALFFAMIIFLSIKKLQCPRNRLHMHLFASFIMRGFMSLLKDFIFVEGIALKSDLVYTDGILKYTKQHYNWICKVITSSRNYFIMANYTLILMEGIYLHNLIFLTLCSDKTKITLYYLIGWAFPLLFIIPWILMRFYYEDTMCWTTSTNTNYLLLIHGPIALSIIVNFILFIMIVRILLMKLNSIYIQHQRTKYRRLLRSTLILIPLFGVPYVISLMMLYSSTINKTAEIIWIFFDQTFSAFQGFFVALVYCLLNTEVHNEIKHKYVSIRDRHEHNKQSRERTISHTLQCPTVIMPLNEDIPMTNYNIKYV
ncbi:hypothetical protein RI129_007484 [Pyrocoelia pectoralis]|uniref:Parathyroid hormone/parathyroid hormone-related peptide receptor n=1 Tax=Pyrocoelia pectoralis TaxID=417401 RepID=A0AAN7VHW0_9COLE